MAIVNEDTKMVKYLLDCGANVHQRCMGRFFLPDDQKGSPIDFNSTNGIIQNQDKTTQRQNNKKNNDHFTDYQW